MTQFNETLYTYKRMEGNVQNRRKNLVFKIPKLEKCFDAVQMLKEQPVCKIYRVRYADSVSRRASVQVRHFMSTTVWQIHYLQTVFTQNIYTLYIQ